MYCTIARTPKTTFDVHCQCACMCVCVRACVRACVCTCASSPNRSPRLIDRVGCPADQAEQHKGETENGGRSAARATVSTYAARPGLSTRIFQATPAMSHAPPAMSHAPKQWETAVARGQNRGSSSAGLLPGPKRLLGAAGAALLKALPSQC
jgi:hypothetical protein